MQSPSKKSGRTNGSPPGVDRSIIERGAEMLGMDLTELITETIMGMRTAAAELDLAGTAQPEAG